jgi:hypothetical protein
MHTTIRRWLTHVGSASLLGEGETEQLSTQNMLAFAVSADEARRMTTDDLNHFLEAAFRQYALKLANTPGPLWFSSSLPDARHRPRDWSQPKSPSGAGGSVAPPTSDCTPPSRPRRRVVICETEPRAECSSPADSVGSRSTGSAA